MLGGGKPGPHSGFLHPGLIERGKVKLTLHLILSLPKDEVKVTALSFDRLRMRASSKKLIPASPPSPILQSSLALFWANNCKQLLLIWANNCKQLLLIQTTESRPRYSVSK